MSGCSGSTTCPNCGKECDEYTDWKPFNYSVITCSYCGLVIGPAVNYMDLEELNDYRTEQGLRKLRKLPKQNKDVW